MTAKLVANTGYRSSSERSAFGAVADAVPQALYENTDTVNTKLVNSWISPSSVTGGLVAIHTPSAVCTTSLLATQLATVSKFSLHTSTLGLSSGALSFNIFGLAHYAGLRVGTSVAPVSSANGFLCGLLVSVDPVTTAGYTTTNNLSVDSSMSSLQAMAPALVDAARSYVRNSWKSTSIVIPSSAFSLTEREIESRLSLFSGAMLGDYFYGAEHARNLAVIAELQFSLKTSENLTTDALAGLDLIKEPTAAVWYNNADADRPVRFNSDKLYEPSLFAAKVENLPSLRVKFYRKSLFDWSQNWSTQMLSYSLPLYRMYRGGLSHKPNTNYWSTGGSNSAEFDQFVWSDLFVQITKNAEFNFVPSVQTRVNQPQAPKLFAQVLDKESTPFVKNQVVSLPNPHEEFDINYVYQY